ncbi:molybdopterin-guanine dinucleotide biosynthesis protein B [Diaphorobacter sp. HDW4A]|uniref:molybdopterin-guanine dinucleotide biosynthesis protein B n=1 Tax=Diaphorobacter sp. HDW4A TaxID=2714924 RepID=UPI00140C81BE|nr:molybdopterin-guanine dinucleotide biosynthesis protein B [Diaphorobacter sp. HDW4A]QIL78749.1 molybdopterin-guanine dinucleotide biosynthesis protein B [Diaphorobacter sp. HDW4A]
MKAIGFAGYSGAGKTTALEQIIRSLRTRGLRVSVVKHAHHDFDVDVPGKDSWRHRKAGAFEVLVVSDRRLALMREFEEPCDDLSVHEMLAELDHSVDWAIVEGFKRSDLPKIEIWREPAADEKPRTLRYPEDADIQAIATDDANCLPDDCTLPVLDLNDPANIVEWMLANGARFEYVPPATNHQENRL